VFTQLHGTNIPILDWLLCRATFDTDNIDIGPERRAYLETCLERVWEVNSQVCVCCGQSTCVFGT
jgi:hypothetical protein